MASSRNGGRERKLPEGYVTIKEICEKKIPPGRFVGVIGLVKDRRAPIPVGTRNDWKSSITLYDKSVEDQDVGLTMNIFRPENEMPQPGAKDVVVVSSAKVQTRPGDDRSLLSNKTTVIYVYSSDQIPRPPESAKQALLPLQRKTDRPPSDAVHDYVSWLYDSIDKDLVPDVHTFNTNVEQSRNVRSKFQTLDKVKDGQFYDIIVNVVRAPSHTLGKTTIWVSDYTQNDNFRNFPWGSEEVSVDQSNALNTLADWSGPYGKHSMQLRCFGQDGDFIMDQVKVGHWVQLRNVQIKFNEFENSLVGFLREDHGSWDTGLRVDVLLTNDPDNASPRLKDAIRRKRDYEEKKKKQRKNLAKNIAAKAGGNENDGKRKAEGQPEGQMNSKNRRAEQRAMKLKQAEEKEKEREARLGLNELVKCESPDQPISPVSFITERKTGKTTVNGQEVTLSLPFTCAKYRANVRVVDFYPHKLEDFAVGRKIRDTDMLSDHGGDTDSEEDSEDDDDSEGAKTWEWKFALKLEDANPKRKDEDNTIWVVVDNSEGQTLLDLDASNLNANPERLAMLQEQLFKLWGNLEETRRDLTRDAPPRRKRIAAKQPPPSSPVHGPSTSNQKQPPGADKNNNINEKEPAISNKPFSCCIREYGVSIPEQDPSKANAGDGRRWERMFGLFGTRITALTASEPEADD